MKDPKVLFFISYCSARNSHHHHDPFSLIMIICYSRNTATLSELIVGLFLLKTFFLAKWRSSDEEPEREKRRKVFEERRQNEMEDPVQDVYTAGGKNLTICSTLSIKQGMADDSCLALDPFRVLS